MRLNKTTQTPPPSAVVLLTIFSTMLVARTAAAQECRRNSNWTGWTQIEVYVHPDTANNLKHANEAEWTDIELLDAVKDALEQLQEGAPSNAPRFKFMGYSSGVAANGRIPGAIHIVPWLGSEAPCNDTPTAWMDDGTPILGHMLVIKRSGTGYLTGTGDLGLEACGKRYEHFRESYDGVTTMRAIIMHEVMHSLGFDHYLEDCDYQCESEPCSVTQNEGWSHLEHNPYRWDWERLKNLYGNFSSSSSKRRHFESTNATTWNLLSGTAVPVTTPLFGAHSNPSSQFVMFAMKDTATLVPLLWRYTPSSAYWDSWGSATTAPSLGRVGAADDVTGGYKNFLAWLDLETITNPIKPITVARFSSPGSYQRTHFNNWPVRHQGIAIAHDPKNDVQVLAYRNSLSRIVLHVHSNDYLSPLTLILSNEHSSDAPSVTCGDASLLYNCIVTWSDAPTTGPATRRIRWAHFYTMQNPEGYWTVTLGPVIQGGYPTYGPPSVAYLGPTTSDCAYVLAWKVPGSTYYTNCKRVSTTAFWSSGTERSFTIPYKVSAMSPAVGAKPYAIELLNVGK